MLHPPNEAFDKSDPLGHLAEDTANDSLNGREERSLS